MLSINYSAIADQPSQTQAISLYLSYQRLQNSPCLPWLHQHFVQRFCGKIYCPLLIPSYRLFTYHWVTRCCLELDPSTFFLRILCYRVIPGLLVTVSCFDTALLRQLFRWSGLDRFGIRWGCAWSPDLDHSGTFCNFAGLTLSFVA